MLIWGEGKRFMGATEMIVTAKELQKLKEMIGGLEECGRATGEGGQAAA